VAQRTRKPTGATRRVARHRKRLTTSGAKRVEVTVPARDAELVRDVAALLRAGGDQANRVRKALSPLIRTKVAGSGRDLVAFFRNSPLVGAELEFERDKSPGRAIDL
jgi:hypothetical protein